jgi:hypothetical protein
MQDEARGFKLPAQPREGQAMIYVVRSSPLGGAVRFNVHLNDKSDDVEMGYTRASQYIYFAVRPGRHVIYSKAENWAEIEISLAEGQVAFIRQDVEIGVLMARNNLSRLEDYEGRYFVKTLTPGTMHKTADTRPPLGPPPAASAPPQQGGASGPVKLEDLEGLLPK